MDDLISRQAAIDALEEYRAFYCDNTPDAFSKLSYVEKSRVNELDMAIATLCNLPSAQPERLTDDDFETIRIHLNAHKEKLCNQQRWKEAEEYQHIIDRFMAFASAEPERKKGKWIPFLEEYHDMFKCSNCGNITRVPFKCSSPPYYYCPNCGAVMREEKDNAKVH